MIDEIQNAGLRVIRWFHNRKRLKLGVRLYAHNTADDTWSRTCHTVGDLIWTPRIDQAEPMHPTEFAGVYKRRKFTKPMHLLTLEGWTEVWLYTEEEWTLMLYENTFGHKWSPKV